MTACFCFLVSSNITYFLNFSLPEDAQGLINTILFVTTRPIVSFNTSLPMFRRLTGASVRRKGSDVSFSASISSTEKGSHSEIIEYNKAVDILDNNVCTDLNYQDSIRSRLIFERRTSDGELPINMDQEKVYKHRKSAQRYSFES